MIRMIMIHGLTNQKTITQTMTKTNTNTNTETMTETWQGVWNCLHFRQSRTWLQDNHCDLTIKSDTGQHSQFLRCFSSSSGSVLLAWVFALLGFRHGSFLQPSCYHNLQKSEVMLHLNLERNLIYIYIWSVISLLKMLCLNVKGNPDSIHYVIHTKHSLCYPY